MNAIWNWPNWLIRQCEGLRGQVVCQEKGVRGLQPKKNIYASASVKIKHICFVQSKTSFSRMYLMGVICYDLATLCIFKSNYFGKLSHWQKDATVLSFFKLAHIECDSKKDLKKLMAMHLKSPKFSPIDKSMERFWKWCQILVTGNGAPAEVHPSLCGCIRAHPSSC